MKFLFLLIAAGCGTPAVELGTGVDRFIAVHDGDEVPIVMGLQGGYHVWGAVRAEQLAATGLKLRFTLSRDGEIATVRTDTVDLSDGEHLGTAVFLPDPDAVRGQQCRLALEATDENGQKAYAEHLLVPR